MDFSAIEASLLDDDDDDDLGFDLPVFNLEDKKPAPKVAPAKPAATGSKPAVSSTKSSAAAKPAAAKPAAAKPAVATGKASQIPARSSSKAPVKQLTTTFKKPSNYSVKLTGKETKQLQGLYEQYQSGGLSQAQFVEVIDALGLVDDEKISHADLPDVFAEATGSKHVASFDEFLQAMAIFALRRYPAGNTDPTAAVQRLLEAMAGDEEAKAEEEAQNRRKAVYEATRRAAERAKAARLAQEAKAFDEAAVAQTEEKSPEEAAKEEEVARQRAYLRAKARIVASKEKEQMDKEQEEKDKVAEEERALEMAKLRAEARARALQRAQDRVLAAKHAEEEAMREEEELRKSKDEKNAKVREEAIKRAQERVKAAKEATHQNQHLEEEEETKQKEAEKQLKLAAERMSSQGYLAATERNRERLKQALKAEQEHRLLQEKEAREREEREAVVVKEATARAVERTTVRKDKIELDEDTETDLHKLFDPFAIKDRLHKPRWPELLQKYKLVDGMHLKKSQLDLIFSKNAEKGTKGLDFKHFCEAIAEVGNTRFKTKDPNPNEAISRVLLATVRKLDPEEVARRKAELAEQKKEYEEEQQELAWRARQQEEARQEQAAEEQAARRAEREARLQALLEELEEDKIENEKKAARREKARQERERREAEEAALAREQKMRDIQERNEELEEERKLAQKRTQERLAATERKERENAERRAKEAAARAEKDALVTEEGRKKAAARVAAKKKQEVHLSEHDMGSMKTLYGHFKSGRSFSRSDWLNCTTSLGLEGKSVSKADLERLFDMAEKALNKGSSGLLLEHFCYAMGLLALNTHPSEDPAENEPTKALERLLGDVMGGSAVEDKEFDPSIKEEELPEHLQETEEEKTARLEEARKKAQERAATKRRREEEARQKAEEEARVELERKAENEKKVAEGRAKAAARIKTQKADVFSIAPKDQEQLEVFYDHFRIAANGMTRGDWLNCVSTLGVMDDENVGKQQCIVIFDEVCADGPSKAHMSLEQFGTAMSKIGQLVYTEDNLHQTQALHKLMAALMEA